MPSNSFRKQHCCFKQLNSRGKCIADCHHTKFPKVSDCAGYAGKTMDLEDCREVTILPGMKIGVLPNNPPKEKAYTCAVPETPKSSTSWGNTYVMKSNLKK